MFVLDSFFVTSGTKAKTDDHLLWKTSFLVLNLESLVSIVLYIVSINILIWKTWGQAHITPSWLVLTDKHSLRFDSCLTIISSRFLRWYSIRSFLIEMNEEKVGCCCCCNSSGPTNWREKNWPQREKISEDKEEDSLKKRDLPLPPTPHYSRYAS